MNSGRGDMIVSMIETIIDKTDTTFLHRELVIPVRQLIRGVWGSIPITGMICGIGAIHNSFGPAHREARQILCVI